MTSGVILAGLGLAVIGFAGISVGQMKFTNDSFTGLISKQARRYAVRYGKVASEAILKQIPVSANSKYYKGGFEQKMSKREASLVLGVSPSATKTKIKDAHKRIMLANHPDRGGSPYIAAKINEAKDILDKP